MKTKQQPSVVLRGWSNITAKQIQHDWQPPSWKSLWRHNAVADGPIRMRFGRPTQNADDDKISKWNREIEFQYGGRLFSQTGSSNIAGVNWDILSKLGMQITFDVLKCDTSPNRKPEVKLRLCNRQIGKSNMKSSVRRWSSNSDNVFKPTQIKCRLRLRNLLETGREISIWRPLVFRNRKQYLGSNISAMDW